MAARGDDSAGLEVVIPTWNARERLARALGCLRDQKQPAPVCVVDNGSVDGSAEMVERSFPATRLIRLERNSGFGAAVNLAARSSSAALLVTLNNDAEAAPEFLREIAAVHAATGAEMIAACLLTPDGRIDSLGLELDRALWAYDMARGEPYGGSDRARLEPLAPCGGAAAYERAAFLAAGGFDEEFFAYLEDVELGIRLRAAGARCALAYSARAVHRHSATLGSGSRAKNRLMGSSRGYLLWRHGAGLTRRERLRGLVGDAVLYGGQIAIDRNAGALLGRLERRRRIGTRRRPAPEPGFGQVPRIRLSLAAALRRRLARRI